MLHFDLHLEISIVIFPKIVTEILFGYNFVKLR